MFSSPPSPIIAGMASSSRMRWSMRASMYAFRSSSTWCGSRPAGMIDGMISLCIRVAHAAGLTFGSRFKCEKGCMYALYG